MRFQNFQITPNPKIVLPQQHWSVGFSRGLCRSFLFILRIKITFKPEDLKNVRLMCCNHVSWLDVVILHAFTGCAFVAKKEVQTWPLVGLLARHNGTLFVDRSNLAGRVRCLQNLQNLQNQNNVPVVCVFPEGTTRRTFTPSRQDWKQG